MKGGGKNARWIRLWGDSTQRREDAKVQRSEAREKEDKKIRREKERKCPPHGSEEGV